MAAQLAERLQELLAPIVTENGLELFDLSFAKEGPNWYLRIFIDKDGGVSIDDCETISRLAEKVLDEHDPIEQAYILEVCSPGIDRPLKKDADYEKYKGEIVDVKLYRPVSAEAGNDEAETHKKENPKKEFQGKLLGLSDGVLSIEIENGEVLRFDKATVALCRLAVLF